jgi:hypothetical protein
MREPEDNVTPPWWLPVVVGVPLVLLLVVAVWLGRLVFTWMRPLLVTLLLPTCVACQSATAMRLSSEHIPPWANPVSEDAAIQMMNAALYPEAASSPDLDEVYAEVADRNHAMNVEHEEVGDLLEPAPHKPDTVYAGPVRDLLPGAPPSDWTQYEERRIARGSSLDWVPRAMLDSQPCVTESMLAPYTESDVVAMSMIKPVLQDQGVTIPYNSQGIVCVEGLTGNGARLPLRCVSMKTMRLLLYPDHPEAR